MPKVLYGPANNSLRIVGRSYTMNIQDHATSSIQGKKKKKKKKKNRPFFLSFFECWTPPLFPWPLSPKRDNKDI
jgi:hypothetical protein